MRGQPGRPRATHGQHNRWRDHHSACPPQALQRPRHWTCPPLGIFPPRELPYPKSRPRSPASPGTEYHHKIPRHDTGIVLLQPRFHTGNLSGWHQRPLPVESHLLPVRAGLKDGPMGKRQDPLLQPLECHQQDGECLGLEAYPRVGVPLVFLPTGHPYLRASGVRQHHIHDNDHLPRLELL